MLEMPTLGLELVTKASGLTSSSLTRKLALSVSLMTPRSLTRYIPSLNNSVSPSLAPLLMWPQVATLDRALDAFLIGNTSWCNTVFTAVSATHAAAASLGSGSVGQDRPPASPRGAASGRRDDPVVDQPDRSSGSGSSSSGGRNGDGGGQTGTASDNGVGGVATMSAAMKRGLLCVKPPSAPSSGPVSPPPHEERLDGGDSATERGEDDEPLAAALRLRLFRRVLQSGGADGRAIASSVGLPTEGSRRQAARERAHQDGRERAMQEGSGGGGMQNGLSPNELEGTLDQGPRWEEGERGGEARRERGGSGGREARARCGPPLTPALEVAVRLLADGYKCAVMLQVRRMSFWR